MGSFILLCGLAVVWVLFFVGIVWKCVVYAREARERAERQRRIIDKAKRDWRRDE